MTLEAKSSDTKENAKARIQDKEQMAAGFCLTTAFRRRPLPLSFCEEGLRKGRCLIDPKDTLKRHNVKLVVLKHCTVTMAQFVTLVEMAGAFPGSHLDRHY